MPDTRDAFLAAIRANPDSDLPRLVYADWLDEQAGGSSERAELIRVQIRHPGHQYAYLSGLGLIGNSERDVAVRSDRGFISFCQCDFASWLAHADRILPESVGLTVRLTDEPELRIVSRPGEDAKYVVLGGTLATGGVAWKVPVGCEVIPRDQIPEITEGLLRANWPDVATWELSPAWDEMNRRMDQLIADDYHDRLVRDTDTLLRVLQSVTPVPSAASLQHGTAAPPASD